MNDIRIDAYDGKYVATVGDKTRTFDSYTEAAIWADKTLYGLDTSEPAG